VVNLSIVLKSFLIDQPRRTFPHTIEVRVLPMVWTEYYNTEYGLPT